MVLVDADLYNLGKNLVVVGACMRHVRVSGRT